MYLAMYKNGSSSWGLGMIEEAFVGNNGSEPMTSDIVVAGEEGSEESLSVQESTDETFAWCKRLPDPELSELGDTGWSVRLELEEAPGLGVGWTLHWENSAGTVRPCMYSSLRCQQSVAVCP